MQREEASNRYLPISLFLCGCDLRSRSREAGQCYMKRRISCNDPGHAHFLTFSCFRRAQILADEKACALLAEVLNSARLQHNFDLWAYVFMPDHVHLLIRPRSNSYSISRILKSIKGPLARRYVDECKKIYPKLLKRLEVHRQSGLKYRVWERGGGYDRNLITREYIRRAIDYIEFNPVRVGMVSEAKDWRWSSFRARAGFSEVPVRIDEVNWELADDAQPGLSRKSGTAIKNRGHAD